MLYKTLKNNRDVVKQVRILNKVLSQIKNKPKKKTKPIDRDWETLHLYF